MIPGINPALLMGGLAQTSTPTPTPTPGAFTPADLGSKLRAWFDAEDPVRRTMSGSSVTQWASHDGSVVLAKDSYGVNAYSATAVGGRPGIKVNGLAGSMPNTGTFPIEIWATCHWSTAFTNDFLQTPFGGFDDVGSFAMVFVPNSGFFSPLGVAALDSNFALPTAALSTGVHAVRVQLTGSAAIATANNGTPVSAAGTVAGATSGVLSLIVGNDGNGASFFNDPTATSPNAVNNLAITKALTTAEAASMWTFMNSRKAA